MYSQHIAEIGALDREYPGEVRALVVCRGDAHAITAAGEAMEVLRRVNAKLIAKFGTARRTIDLVHGGHIYFVTRTHVTDAVGQHYVRILYLYEPAEECTRRLNAQLRSRVVPADLIRVVHTDL